MSKRRKKKGSNAEEHDNAERWLLTYADMITLLMVLFIVLFAIGQVDQKKFDKLHDGLAKEFGNSTVLDGGAGLLDGSAQQVSAPDEAIAGDQALQRQREAVLAAQQAQDAARLKLENDIKAALQKRGLAKSVEFQTLEQKGLVLNIVTDKLLFDTGKATLRPQGARVLDALAPALRGLPNEMVVEGHTDSQPISSAQFASNWELSTARATTVLRYLLRKGLEAKSISAAGYADTRPLAAGTSASQRPKPSRRHRHPVRAHRLDDGDDAVPDRHSHYLRRLRCPPPRPLRRRLPPPRPARSPRRSSSS